MPFELFDRNLLRLKPLAERTHDMDRSSLIFPTARGNPSQHERWPMLAGRIVAAGGRRPGGDLHVRGPRAPKGDGPLLADLIAAGPARGHLALNGAGAIHDFEMALIGATCGKRRPLRSRGPIRPLDRYRPDQRRRPRRPRSGIGLGEAVGRHDRGREVPLSPGERAGGRRAAERAGHGPRRHRLGHRPRASQLRPAPPWAPPPTPNS